jgi:hypothetical protein
MVESPRVWLVEARGVVDGVGFGEAERFVFEDGPNNFLNKSGILIRSGSSWRGSSAIPSLLYRIELSALHEFLSYLDSFECAI